MLQLIYKMGMRVLEVVRLHTADFDKQLYTITIHHSKGRKIRTVPYRETLRHNLCLYGKTIGSVPPNILLESIKEPGQPLSPRGVQYNVRNAVKRSRINKRIHPHTLRHTFAVHYLNLGDTPPQLQQLLGHEYITTTLHYIKYAHIPDHDALSVLDTLKK